MRCLVNARPAIRTLLITLLGLGLVAGVSACGNGTSGTPGQRGPVTASVGDLDPVPIGGEPTPVLPATVTSFDGSPVTVTDTSRIIAADRYGTLAQTVVALGLGSKLVGRSNSAAFPAVKDLPTVSSGSGTLSVEAVAALRPTVFLTDTTAVTPALREQLKALGITVVYFDDKRTLDGVVPQIQAVADALGVTAAGKALAKRTGDEIAAATASVPHQDAKPKIAFLYLRSTAITMIFGPGSGAESLISAIGGVDAATASGVTQDFLPITSEAMIAAAPDVLLVMSDGLASVGGVDGLEKVPGVAQTPAGRDRRVVDMNDAVLLSFGPNTGRVLTALIKAIYGTPTA
ncbi:heme/hemin ABC transporter substrate-binding protein [Nocardia sp. CDC160]|uniref:heme/hemin ABC transporter substrate-binding protein n=1 Tax=Nocardia sp. CDC160 TaxID=3112166 RepID=UPI002DBF1091|nr:ABC transporter substrate-binding protein [Nocardia sp. CDC160]MEC3917379.1 ABC transporter substrate-binding protein [Nocardia sp. CDC160]